MGFIPNVYEEHEANPWLEKLAPIALVVGILLVILFQQFLRTESGATLTTPLPEVQAFEEAREPTVSNLVVRAKVVLKVRYFLNMAHANEELRESDAYFKDLEAEAVSRVDRFRMAIVATELYGAKAGVERLEKLETEVESNGELASETYWMLKRYRQVAKYDEYQETKKTFDVASKDAVSKKKPAPPTPAVLKASTPSVEAMSDEMQLSLVGRHGFFGKVALLQGPDADTGARHELLGGYLQVEEFNSWLFTIRALMGVTGLIILGYYFKKALGGEEIGLRDPAAPTTVFLEMFTIEMLAFAILVAIGVLLLGNRSPVALLIQEIVMWMLPLCVIWPLLRGVSWSDAMNDLGLHKGAGVMKEVMIGIGGACASIPLLGILEAIITIVQIAMDGGEASSGPIVKPPGMYEVPDGGTWGLVWLSTLGSVIYAPFIEEILYRGALQRWLRVRLSWFLAVLISSIVFGIIHPYSISGLIAVAFGGLCMGLMREWRQCLIAPIVMHFMHNGFIALHKIGFLTNLG